MEHEGDDYLNCNWCTRYSHQMISTGAGGLENKGTNGDQPNYSIVEIGQNTENSLGDLRRLTVTQTPVENPNSGGENSPMSKIIIVICLISHMIFSISHPILIIFKQYDS